MITFVTFFAQDIERTADVYRLLGLDFISEQHGLAQCTWPASARVWFWKSIRAKMSPLRESWLDWTLPILTMFVRRYWKPEFRSRGTLIPSPVCVV